MSKTSGTYQISKDNFLLVQAVSDYDPRKAPKVSDFVALPSKYCVVVSKPKFLEFQKNTMPKERKRFNSLKT
ncbi:hypothetical protein CM15mP43_10090 [bacterium]|nr:MAG: hypothetical protein CM15mP43_10090 [bacterium]